MPVERGSLENQPDDIITWDNKCCIVLFADLFYSFFNKGGAVLINICCGLVQHEHFRPEGES